MSTPARQPFASLSGSRLRNLTNIKNKQNALPTTMAPSVKRHAPAEFDDVDTENIDPLMFLSPSKKAREFEFDCSQYTKAPCFTLAPFRTPGKHVEVAKVAGQKRKAEDSASTPDTLIKRRAEPASAPAPAGRSPKHKRSGIMSRRLTRVNPPSRNGVKSSLPFSIDAALAGTVPVKSKSKSKSKEWYFDIWEDSPEVETMNIFYHSTDTLDISDDETRQATKGDCDNKENIPPVDYQSGSNAAITRRDIMTDEVRSPLGDLNTKDFYAPGCDSSSCILVPAEDCEGGDGPVLSSNIHLPCSPSVPHAEAQQGWDDRRHQAVVSSAAAATTIDSDFGQSSKEEPAAIEIWESESAKGEDDTNTQDDLAVGEAVSA